MNNVADAHDALYISKLLQPKLRGLGPEIQGAVLADLVSILFAGIHADLREEAIEHWTQCMRAMILVSEAEKCGYLKDYPK